jgi:hypothetical protein
MKHLPENKTTERTQTYIEHKQLENTTQTVRIIKASIKREKTNSYSLSTAFLSLFEKAWALSGGNTKISSGS